MPASRRVIRCSTPGCRRSGVGHPPLCRPCYLASMRAPEPVPGDGIAGLIDDVLSGEGISYEAMHGALNDLAWAIGGSLNARPDMLDNDQQQRRQRPPGYPFYFPPQGGPRVDASPPPPVDHQLEARQKARRVLGFPDGLPITAELVKARHRELARKYHPDVAGPGSVAKMQQINAAVDTLMEAL